jgi:hypothetical protein
MSSRAPNPSRPSKPQLVTRVVFMLPGYFAAHEFRFAAQNPRRFYPVSFEHQPFPARASRDNNWCL